MYRSGEALSERVDSHPPIASVLAYDEVEVSAIMPCLNEEETLAACIRKATECFAALGVRGEVIVGDNGSRDHSVEIA